jgi:hypothetical protein
MNPLGHIGGDIHDNAPEGDDAQELGSQGDPFGQLDPFGQFGSSQPHLGVDPQASSSRDVTAPLRPLSDMSHEVLKGLIHRQVWDPSYEANIPLTSRLNLLRDVRDPPPEDPTPYTDAEVSADVSPIVAGMHAERGRPVSPVSIVRLIDAVREKWKGFDPHDEGQLAGFVGDFNNNQRWDDRELPPRDPTPYTADQLMPHILVAPKRDAPREPISPSLFDFKGIEVGESASQYGGSGYVLSHTGSGVSGSGVSAQDRFPPSYQSSGTSLGKRKADDDASDPWGRRPPQAPTWPAQAPEEWDDPDEQYPGTSQAVQDSLGGQAHAAPVGTGAVAGPSGAPVAYRPYPASVHAQVEEYASQGKKAPEIAELMNLKTRTVVSWDAYKKYNPSRRIHTEADHANVAKLASEDKTAQEVEDELDIPKNTFKKWRAWLDNHTNRPHTEADRADVAELASQDKTAPQIEGELGISQRTFKKWPEWIDNHKAHTEADHADVAELASQDKTAPQIEGELGISQRTFKKWPEWINRHQPAQK